MKTTILIFALTLFYPNPGCESKCFSCSVLDEAIINNQIFNQPILKGDKIYVVDTFGFFDTAYIPNLNPNISITRRNFRAFNERNCIIVNYIKTVDSSLAIGFYYPQTGLEVFHYFRITGGLVTTHKKEIGYY